MLSLLAARHCFCATFASEGGTVFRPVENLNGLADVCSAHVHNAAPHRHFVAEAAIHTQVSVTDLGVK
jgi:hypothetical protein